MIKNALTFDIEDVVDSRINGVLLDNTSIKTSVIKRFFDEILDLLDEHCSKATFFVLGIIAKELPDLVKAVYNRGHEIASHGYYHHSVYNLTPEEFRRDLLQSIKVLQDITGGSILGYRAPSWSITNKSLWALKIIKECGLRYDSSISPSENFLYGAKGVSRLPYLHEEGIWEIPPTTVNLFGKAIIVGGGFYLRTMPYWFTKIYHTSINKRGRYAVVYLHPHELLNYNFNEKLSLKENIILNFGKRNCRKKFINLLKDFEFNSLKSILGI